jgi:hypothetical protein
MSSNARMRAVRSKPVRKALLAPEIERYLSRGSVDLLVTDQVEALKVRVARGLEVLERKAKLARQVAHGRALLDALVVVIGFALPAGHALMASSGRLDEGGAGTGAALWALAALSLAVGTAAFIDLVRVVGDSRRLRLLGRDRTADLEAAKTAEEVLRIAEEALADARAAGAVPREG